MQNPLYVLTESPSKISKYDYMQNPSYVLTESPSRSSHVI